MQHDNAPAHVPTDYKDVAAAGNKGRNAIKLCAQPPYSPDFNVLDLGMFAGIQSLQYKEAPRNVAELVNAVEKTYGDKKAESIEDNFLTLQKCMESSMKVCGGNDYKLPQMNKKALRRANKPLTKAVCDEDTSNLALRSLKALNC